MRVLSPHRRDLLRIRRIDSEFQPQAITTTLFSSALLDDSKSIRAARTADASAGSVCAWTVAAATEACGPAVRTAPAPIT